MSIRLSHSAFPCTPEQKARAALPWGLLLQPLAPLPHASSQTRLLSNTIPRCTSCLAYINPYVHFVRGGWKCSLCRAQNSFPSRRYLQEDERHRMPELVLPDVEYLWVDEEQAQTQKGGRGADVLTAEEEEALEAEERAAIEAYQASRDPTAASYDPSATLVQPFAARASASVSPPAYVFLVDLSAEPGVLELVKSALLAALEGLPSSVWVGLCVVSQRVGLYDLKCSIPTVAYTTVRSSVAASTPGAPSLDDMPLSLPLHALLPLDSFLQKLAHCKENLAAAIESLVSHAPRTAMAEMARQVSVDEKGNEVDPEAGGSASPSAPSHAPGLSNSRMAAATNSSSTAAAASSSATAPSAPATAPSSSSSSSAAVNPCGFGAAVAALLLYLSSVSEQGLQLNARVLSFLTQRPNYGLGALPDRSGVGGGGGGGGGGEQQQHVPNADDADRFEFRAFEGPMAPSGRATARNTGSHVSSRTCADFYREHGNAASQRGVCIDLYVVARERERERGDASSSTHSNGVGGGGGGGGGATHIELATLKYLTLLTGGNLLFYASARECSLPQDLFRQLRSAQAFRCMLRVRTSPELVVSNVYGHLLPDERFDQLYLGGGGDARKCYGVDLDFRGSQGFNSTYGAVTPVIQVAFSYIGVFAGPDGVERVEHRLRVLTRQIPCVFDPLSSRKGAAAPQTRAMALELQERSERQAISELFAAAAPEVVLTLLVQQLIHATLERGVSEARLLLRDWLVSVMLAYHDVFSKQPEAGLTPAQAAVAKAKAHAAAKAAAAGEETEALSIDSFDLALSQAPNLQFLPRFVCALLKSPLLAVTAPGGVVSGSLSASSAVLGASSSTASSADARVYLHLLYSALECDYLVKSIYPTLSSFKVTLDDRLRDAAGGVATPDCAAMAQGMSLTARQGMVSLQLHHPVLYLTRFSLSGCGDHIFLLDSYVHLRVLYLSPLFSTPAARAGLLPLPPPAASDVSRAVKRAKTLAPYLTPKVVFCAEEGADIPPAAHVLGAGKDATRHFLDALLEDETGGHGAFSYATFLQEVGREMISRLQGAQE